MRRRGERAIWTALQKDGIRAATMAALDFVGGVEAEYLPVWACVIAATPKNGQLPLRHLAAAIRASELTPHPALDAVVRLARAIRADDGYTAARMVGKIRHYAPGTSRHRLASVIIALHRADEIAPASGDADALFNDLNELSMT